MSSNVLILATALSGGGAEYVARLMAENIARSSCVLFENQAGIASKKYSIHVVPYIKLNWPIAKIALNLYRLIYIQWTKLRTRPVATISHLEGPNFTNLLTIGGGRRIIIVHNSLNKNYSNAAAFGRTKRLLARWLYSRADRIIGVSNDICEELANDYDVNRYRLGVIENPIDIERIKKLSKAQLYDWRDELLKQDYLVNVASLTEQKNHELLIHVYSRVVRQFPGLKLVLVGKGEKESEIRCLCNKLGLDIYGGGERSRSVICSSQVFFLGFQENPYPFIENSRLFVMTSHWEGMPITLLESMALGKPIVISDCSSSVRRVMGDKLCNVIDDAEKFCERTKYGYLMRQNNLVNYSEFILDAWVNAISELLLDNNYYSNCSRAASLKSKEYDVDKIVKKWDEMIRI
jgi:glycosyltransferase involved in cell wall biosynthesis